MNRGCVMLTFIAVCLTTALLIGCAATKQIAPVASGTIPANSARIIVLREGGISGSAAPVVIIDSGKQIGEVGLHSQIAWDRNAGPMQLVGFSALDPERTRTPPIQMCVGVGMTYKFMASWPINFNHYPKVELVSGTPVACEKNGTNTVAGNTESSQQSSTGAGDAKIFIGTIESFVFGFHFKSGPPLWPFGMIVVNADNGEKNDFLLVGEGPHATAFYDTDGKTKKEFKNATLIGKKVEVKYEIIATGGRDRAYTISIRYVPLDYVPQPTAPATLEKVTPNVTTPSTFDDVLYIKLNNLKKLLDNGVITKEEFEKEKAKILNQ
ncbi:MAG: SHOCT domain-containing protein [Smithella sp.]